MIKIPRAGAVFPPPGTWSPRIIEGKPTASLACPKCGDAGSLSTHDISATGVVQPSVGCNSDGCDFHDFVVLEDWKA